MEKISNERSKKCKETIEEIDVKKINKIVAKRVHSPKS